MRVLVALTILSGIAGALCLYVASLSPAYVDATGRLVEPFAWMASGRLLLILFVIGVIASISAALVRSGRKRLPLEEKS